jgi:hypothetical protein
VKLVKLIEMCLNETYGNACIGKNPSDAYSLQKDMKRDVLLPLFSTLLENLLSRKSRKIRKFWN